MKPISIWPLHSKLGRLEKAEESYTQSIALRPKHIEAHYNLANTLKAQGKWEEAEANYKQAIVLKPDYIALTIIWV